MNTLVMIIHIIVSIFLIGTVLLQSGKGASIGATFGGGNQAGFGSTQGSFIGKVTAGVAIVFMLTSLALAYVSATGSSSSIMRDVGVPATAVQEDAAVQVEAEQAMEEAAAKEE